MLLSNFANMNTNPRHEFTPADLACHIGHLDDRMAAFCDRIYDLVERIDGRLKVLEAAVAPPPASNTRSRS